MLKYVATAQVRINHADGYASSMQLPYVEFSAMTNGAARYFAHEHYGRMAEGCVDLGSVVIDILVDVQEV